MSKTVVGLYSTMAEAEKVKATLVADGYTTSNINVMSNDSTGLGSGSDTTGANTGEGFGQKISNFFHSLTGGDEGIHSHYASGLNQGGALLAVTVPDEDAAEVSAILKEYGARDIDAGYGSTATSGVPVYGSNAASTAEGTTIPIVEEELVVGKREVDRGGVRVYSHVTERPVSADVTLREERVNVERRPVDRAATAADFQAGQGSVIELTAMGEEAVVGKTSRVVEEVVVGKQTTQRTEAVHDSVRKTEVDVEDLAHETVKKDRY